MTITTNHSGAQHVLHSITEAWPDAALSDFVADVTGNATNDRNEALEALQRHFEAMNGDDLCSTRSSSRHDTH